MTLGDLNITQIPPKDHQITHTPPQKKFCVLHSKCSITGPSETQRNETTQDKLILNNVIIWWHISLFKAVSQLNMYHFFNSKNVNNDNNDKNNDNTENNGL